MGGHGSGHRLFWRRRQVEWSFELEMSALAERALAPGVEATLELPAKAFAWRLPCRYILRDDGRGLLVTAFVPTTAGMARSDVRLPVVGRRDGTSRRCLRCPGIEGGPDCGYLASKLYWPYVDGRGFACRVCHRLAYRSSQTRTIPIEELRRRVFAPRTWPQPLG